LLVLLLGQSYNVWLRDTALVTPKNTYHKNLVQLQVLLSELESVLLLVTISERSEILRAITQVKVLISLLHHLGITTQEETD